MADAPLPPSGPPTDLAVPALAIYLAGYAVTNIGAFAAIAAAPTARSIADWATAIGRHRWIVVSLVVCLLGLVGTPPTAVFVGKLVVFVAAWDGGLAWLVVVAALIVAGNERGGRDNVTVLVLDVVTAPTVVDVDRTVPRQSLVQGDADQID